MSFVDNSASTEILRDFRASLSGFWMSFNDEGIPSGSQSFDHVSHSPFVTVAGQSVKELRNILNNADQPVFTFLSYDLRKELEVVPSTNPDHYSPPGFLCLKSGMLEVNGAQVLRDICRGNGLGHPVELKPTLSREAYIAKIRSIKRHIQLGDVYELNFCFEHVADNVEMDPLAVFAKLRSQNPSAFTAYFKHNGLHCICNSPERFMAKCGSRVFSQPMKGTNSAAENRIENDRKQEKLRTDAKERSENIMITDLVRNDLSKWAKPGSVKVDELCGVYNYGSVNQMISTVSCELKDGCTPIDAVLGAFPMGSMTGAPKHRAMQLIDHYEDFSRGIFSGSIGYFKPSGDFDLNVIIRSLIYHETTKRLSLPTGSAITIHSDPDREYDECLLKAQRIKEILNAG